jgi:nucleoside-triphosphatase THEP1
MEFTSKYLHIVFIITGEVNSGKTNLCKTLIRKIKSRRKSVTGIISPGIYSSSKKIGIYVQEIATGQRVQLAAYAPGWDPENPERKWQFDPAVVQWSNEVIQRSVPTEYLMIDEIGYLELEKGEGWTSALKVLDEGAFNYAFVVVRPSLVDIAKKRWQVNHVFEILKTDDVSMLADRILAYIEKSE